MELKSSHRLSYVMAAASDLVTGDFVCKSLEQHLNNLSMPSGATLSRARARMDVLLMPCRRAFHQTCPDDFLALTLDSTTQRKNLLMIEEYQTDASRSVKAWRAEQGLEQEREGDLGAAEAKMALLDLTLRRVKPIMVLGHGAASFLFKLDSLISSLSLETEDLGAYCSRVISITTDQGTEFKTATAPAVVEQSLRLDKATWPA